LGAEIDMRGYTQLNVGLSITAIGNATNIQFRAVGSFTGTLTAVDSYPVAIETVRAKHGDETAGFYDAAYGCALTEQMQHSLDIGSPFKELA